jgi:DNA-binding HxlR family transcriptional regulator
MNVTIVENQAIERQKKIAQILETTGKANGVCPVQDFLTHFANKWSMLVVLNLGHVESPRFNELKSKVTGISQRMLTVTLRALERDGLISRKLYPEVPPRVEYRLTPLGKSLLDVTMSLGDWAAQHHHEVAKARKNFARRNKDSVAT